MKKRKASPEEQPHNTRTNDNSINAQQLRLYEALQHRGSSGLSTIQGREELDVHHVAARVLELRHKYGHNIQALWANDENAQGKRHRVARYVLFPGKFREVVQ